MSFILALLSLTFTFSSPANAWNPSCDQIGASIGDTLYERNPWGWWVGFNDSRELQRYWFFGTASHYALTGDGAYEESVPLVVQLIRQNEAARIEQNPFNLTKFENEIEKVLVADLIFGMAKPKF